MLGKAAKHQKISKKQKSASELLEQYNMKDNPIDVVVLAKRMGFVVCNAILKDDSDGFIIVSPEANDISGIKADKIIGVNTERDIKDKVFIIAHELGHYILHCKNAQKRYYAHRKHKKEKRKNKKEQAADLFAASLLMPEELFKKRYNELRNKDLSEEDCTSLLAQDFFVSKDAVIRRIKEINNVEEVF